MALLHVEVQELARFLLCGHFGKLSAEAAADLRGQLQPGCTERLPHRRGRTELHNLCYTALCEFTKQNVEPTDLPERLCVADHDPYIIQRTKIGPFDRVEFQIPDQVDRHVRHVHSTLSALDEHRPDLMTVSVRIIRWYLTLHNLHAMDKRAD